MREPMRGSKKVEPDGRPKGGRWEMHGNVQSGLTSLEERSVRRASGESIYQPNAVAHR